MKLVELYDGTAFESQMVKNLLENEGIESYLKDEIIGRSPVWTASSGVKIMVSDMDYEKARIVVEEFEKSRKG